MLLEVTTCFTITLPRCEHEHNTWASQTCQFGRYRSSLMHNLLELKKKIHFKTKFKKKYIGHTKLLLSSANLGPLQFIKTKVHLKFYYNEKEETNFSLLHTKWGSNPQPQRMKEWIPIAQPISDLQYFQILRYYTIKGTIFMNILCL